MRYFPPEWITCIPFLQTTGTPSLDSSHWKMMLSPSIAVWFFSSCVKVAGIAANSKSGMRCQRFSSVHTDDVNKYFSPKIGESFALHNQGMHVTMHFKDGLEWWKNSWSCWSSPTVNLDVGSCHAVSAITNIISSIFRFDISDLQLNSRANLLDEVLSSRMDHLCSFPPNHRNFRFWEFTAQSDTILFLNLLVL